MGYRKRGPKPKHLLVQVPSFARRSNILADICEEESHQKSTPIQMLRPQSQQYQLNSKKHHPYQPVSQDRDADQANGKKFYYQLNSKKHHHYQPDLQEPVFVKPNEVKVPDISNKGYNLPAVLQQKWVRDKDSGCLTKIKDITMELKKLPADLNGHKDPEKVKPKEDVIIPQSNGQIRSGKLKIVKNKNKNGRIVIVMSKYMENGIKSNKIRNEPEKQVPDSSTENHIEKMKLVKKLGLMNGFTKMSKDKPSSGFNRDCPKGKEEIYKMEPTVTGQDKHVGDKGQGQLLVDQDLRLTTKANLVSAPLDMPTENGASQGALKRHHSDTEQNGSCKRFLTSSSISNASSPPPQSIHQNVHPDSSLQDYGYQDEPIDLSIDKSKPKTSSVTTVGHIEAAPQAVVSTQEAETQSPTDTETQPQIITPQTEEDNVMPLSVSDHDKRKEVHFPSFQPYLGNIVITDITTNCLTVTFKEYVTA